MGSKEKQKSEELLQLKELLKIEKIHFKDPKSSEEDPPDCTFIQLPQNENIGVEIRTYSPLLESEFYLARAKYLSERIRNTLKESDFSKEFEKLFAIIYPLNNNLPGKGREEDNFISDFKNAMEYFVKNRMLDDLPESLTFHSISHQFPTASAYIASVNFNDNEIPNWDGWNFTEVNAGFIGIDHEGLRKGIEEKSKDLRYKRWKGIYDQRWLLIVATGSADHGHSLPRTADPRLFQVIDFAEANLEWLKIQGFEKIYFLDIYHYKSLKIYPYEGPNVKSKK